VSSESNPVEVVQEPEQEALRLLARLLVRTLLRDEDAGATSERPSGEEAES